MVFALALFSCLFGASAAPPPAKQISIVKAEFQQYEGGPAVAPNFTYLAGETVFFSFQIAGYQASEDSKVALAYSIDALDPHGVRIVESQRGKVAEELSPEDKAWLPKVRYSFQVPPTADSGKYRLSLAAKDELNGSEAKQDVTLEVRGKQVEPSDTLALRNFRFLRSEEDSKALTPPLYRPGEALWARFEITGFKHADRNRFDVSYGISVRRPGGEVLYSEPKAASEKEESFYPHRWVQGILSLKLDPDIAKGEYLIVVSVRDDVGTQTFEGKYPFRIQ